MKTNSILKSAAWLFALLMSATFVQAQSNATFNVLTAPCNNNGVLEVVFTGMTTPINVTWYTTGATNTYTINTTTDTLFNWSGGYVYVSAYGANGMQGYAYSQGQPPFTYSTTTTPAICPALGSATATVSGGTAPYTFQWYDLQTNATLSTSNPATLPTGGYGLLITDANGCTFGSYANYDSIYVPYQSPVSLVVSGTIASCTNGTAVVNSATGGTSPYTYLWSNGATTSSISGLSMGYYTVTVTDAQGCYAYGAYNVQQSPQITVNTTPTNATCLQNDGSAIAFGSGGTPPYSYQWNNSQNTQTATQLVAGYYMVTATDANGCVGNGYAYISAATPITVTYSSTPSSCTSATGTATVNATGGTFPYNISWSTFPAQTGATATNLSPGNYFFTVTDAVGCVRTGAVTVAPISVVTASTSSGNAYCTSSNGSAQVSVLSGTPPYSYLWSNNATGASISNLSSGYYSCVITDAMNCTITKYVSVQTYSPVSIGFNTTPASCLYNSDGQVSSTVVGGTAPYTYSWSTGGTSSNITTLATGNYSLYVADANGCTDWATVHVPYNTNNNSCYCTITGVVFNDVNGNCIQDAGELGIDNIMMHCSGIGYAYTNANGVYSFMAPTGSYTVSEVVQAFYPLASCQNNAQPVNVTAASNCVTNVDFANTITPIHDVSIYNTMNNVPPIPGHTFNHEVIIANAGTVAENNVLGGYLNDGQLGSATVSPSYFSNASGNWYNTNAGFPNLSTANAQSVNFSYNVPTNIPLGTSLDFKDSAAYTSPMSNWLTDYTPWNNVDEYQPIVVGSFDPNFKEVSPRGIGTQGYITHSDSVLTYTIHFQNTGTYQAENIYVLDTLDADLNLETLDPIYSNHNFTTTINENGVVRFDFANINLPAATNDPIGSNGFVMFTIHLKPNLANGTTVFNNASIYFDFNAPVITNTTLNTIDDNLAAPLIESSTFDVTLFPNPTSIVMHIQLQDASATNTAITVSDITGKVLLNFTTSNKGSTDLNVADFSSGLYLITVVNGNQRCVKKFSVIK